MADYENGRERGKILDHNISISFCHVASSVTSPEEQLAVDNFLSTVIASNWLKNKRDRNLKITEVFRPSTENIRLYIENLFHCE